jgi:NAD(P)H-dependent FMN reductase
MLEVKVIIASTRPIRVGPTVARWFVECARAHGKFQVNLVDLKEVNLPLLDEPKHPRLGNYQHEHTRAWSALVDAADAFVFVTPEYNHGSPPGLVNAIDYLHREWAYKPAGFVSYGGISGGTRSVQMTKLILTTLKVVPMFENVTLPFITRDLTPEGEFKNTAHHDEAARVMLDELHRWAEALRTMRP